jgi:hypothetical protein
MSIAGGMMVMVMQGKIKATSEGYSMAGATAE